MPRSGYQGPHRVRLLDGELQAGPGRGRLPDGPVGAVPLRVRRRQGGQREEGRHPRDRAEGRPPGEGPEGGRLRDREDEGLRRPLPQHGDSLRRQAGHHRGREGHRPRCGRREDVGRRHRRAHDLQVHLHHRPPGPGPGAPHLRGGPHIQLPALADGLFRVVLHGCVLARVQEDRLPPRHQDLSAAY